MEEDGGSCMSLTKWLVTASIGLSAVWVWRKCRVYNTFKDMGVPGPKPLPLLGNMSSAMKLGFIEWFNCYYREYGKVYGVFVMTKPSLVISDLDMLREILVKKSQYFPNRASEIGVDIKPWKDVLTQLKDDHWKHVRSTLSPTFSSGKIKRVMPRIQRVAQTLAEYVKDKAAKGEMVELKELCGRFSMDAIAGVAFGIDLDSVHNPEEEFVKHAQAIMNPSKIFISILIMFPRLFGLLQSMGFNSASQQAIEFFSKVTDMALKDRQQDTQDHHDFLQLLVEAEKEGDNQGPVDAEINHGDLLNTSAQWTRKGLTKDEMEANALIFLLAGYETVATGISFTLFCLANNPQCLKKAQEEVDEKLGKKTVDYDTANSLTYLEMCINETMRLYPPAAAVDRRTSEDVEVGGLTIKKDMGIMVPVCCIHMNPDLWPEPEKFDPERHTAEARADRHPFAFMPFGMGPRNCLGMRLAQLEVRMAVATIIQHFNLLVCEKTVYPVKIEKMRMAAQDGLWVKLQPRE